MENMDVTAVPTEYKRAVRQELQGKVVEVSYPVHNYINSARQLVTNQNINSDEAGRETMVGPAIMKKCNIYLPAGYDANDTNSRYNLLFLLHGVGGDHDEWLHSNGKVDGNYIICNIFDNLIANGDIEPLIIVFPNGRSAHDWADNSFNAAGTNMLGFYYFDYELRYDLIPFIESEYRTYADIKNRSSECIKYNRMHRAIAGLSMGGMQSLNLSLGGFRCDSVEFTGTKSGWKNGLDTTVLAPGMEDLFAYVGAFSNAPTSSEGKVLGNSLASGLHKLSLLYITCGDEDKICENIYDNTINELVETAGKNLGRFYQIIIRDGVHDFNVWNNGAYNFIRFCFLEEEEYVQPKLVKKTL